MSLEDLPDSMLGCLLGIAAIVLASLLGVAAIVWAVSAGG